MPTDPSKATSPTPSAGVALVTGAARNIGRAVALTLAEEGYDIIGLARTDSPDLQEVADEVQRRGRRVFTAACDITDWEALHVTISDGVAALGPVTVLVNNAAVRQDVDPLQMTYDRWRLVLDTILDGSFGCIQAVLPAMIGAGFGRIVNIAGITGQIGAQRRPHVITAKAGLLGLTKAIAHDVAEYGVTVNAVSPAHIDTVRDHTPHAQAVTSNPQRRSGDVEDVAAAVRYLVGPAAGYVTGHTVNVNGGQFMA